MTENSNETDGQGLHVKIQLKWWRVIATKVFVFAVLPILAKLKIVDPEDERFGERVLEFALKDYKLLEVSE